MIIVGVIVLILIATLIAALGTGGSYRRQDGSFQRVKGSHSFAWCIGHPAFEGFGPCSSPFAEGSFVYRVTSPLKISYLCRCLGYQTGAVVDGMNFIIDQKEADALQLLDIYMDEEKQQDPSKKKTKLIFIPGEKGAPFALVCAGGGLNAVVMMQEGFPIAQRLHEEGFNVFLLRYRVGLHAGEDKENARTIKLERAMEDVRAAYGVIFAHADSLGYSVEDYAMWGFSAGGQITVSWALNPRYNFRHTEMPGPAMISSAYSPVEGFQIMKMDEIVFDEKTPACYFSLGEKDSYFPNQTGILKTYPALFKAHETVAVVDTYESENAVGHGFGRGDGTPAEGWMDTAIALWRQQIDKKTKQRMHTVNMRLKCGGRHREY